MPPLDASSAIAWLRLTEPALAAIAPPVRVVEQTAEVERALDDLGTALDAALSERSSALSALLRDPSVARRLAVLLDALGQARRYRLLAWLAEPTLPDHHAVLAAILRTAEHGPRLRNAMSGANRAALLSRIFSPERIAALLTACKTKGRPECDRSSRSHCSP
jgi:hypothetical protein